MYFLEAIRHLIQLEKEKDAKNSLLKCPRLLLSSSHIINSIAIMRLIIKLDKDVKNSNDLNYYLKLSQCTQEL
jgi:hypothetical protein